MAAIIPYFSTAAWAIAGVAAFFVGLTKAGFNGCGLITVVLMAQIMHAKESTGAVLPMLLVGDLLAIYIYRRHVNWRILGGLLPSTLLGLLAGTFLMSRIPNALFGHVLGWMILAMMAVVLWQRLDPRIMNGATHHPLLAQGSGFTAGITSMMANAGGPAMTFYLLARKFDKMAFVGTCAWFFFVTNLAKLPLSCGLGLISQGSLALNLILLPSVVAGVAAGRYMLGKIPQAFFDWLLLVMSTAVAVRMISA